VKTLNKRLRKVARAERRHILECVEEGAEGDLRGPEDPIERCVGDTSTFGDDEVAEAKDKTLERAAGRCTMPPDFAATDAGIVNEVGVWMQTTLVHDVLGSPLDRVVIPKEADRDGTKCQRKVAKRVMRCLERRLKEFRRCVNNGLKGDRTHRLYPDADDPFDDVGDVELCMGFDRKGKIQEDCEEKLADKIEDKCVEEGVPLGEAFGGGVCASAAAKGTDDLTMCLERRAECRACLGLNRAAALTRDCDALDDGAANGSCP
jgi:hypothetical protein